MGFNSGFKGLRLFAYRTKLSFPEGYRRSTRRCHSLV